MAQQTFGRGLAVPQWPTTVTGAPSFATLTTDANDEVAAIVLRAPKTGNVRAIHSSVQVGTGATRRIGLYTVDLTTGAPTSPPTAFAANSFVDKAYVAGDNNDFITSGNFGADCAVTKGAILSVCWITPAATPGNILINTFADQLSQSFPYRALYTGSWALSSGVGNVLFEYDDGTFAIPLGCVAYGDSAANTFTTVAFNSGSNPNHLGARFQFEGPVRVNGAWIWCDLDGDADVYLVDASWDGTSGDALATASLDATLRGDVSNTMHFIEFTATVDLTANTFYRLVVVPTSVTNLSINYASLVSADQMAAQPLGADFHYTTANNPNDDTDWTNYNSGTFRVPFMGLFIDGLSDGAGGGSGGGLKIAGRGGLAG